MKKIIFTLFVLCLTATTQTSQAQISLKEILNSKAVQGAVEEVTGKSNLKFESFAGTWEYVKPACSLESSNKLKEMGGKIVTAEIEKKLADVAKKVGLEPGKFSITFNSDSTFANTVLEKELKGKYKYDPQTNILTLHYEATGTVPISDMEAKVEKSGENMKFLFNASKWKDYIQAASSVANISTLQTLSALLQNYDGIGVGYEVKKK